MQKRKNQSELSNVPRRHGDAAGRLNLIASATLAAYAAVAVGAGAGRAQVPNDDAVGISLNRAAVGETVRVALQGEVIDYDGWSWTPGPVYYTPATGELQQTGGVPFGVAITATRLLVTDGGVSGIEVSPTTITISRDVDVGGDLAVDGNVRVGDGSAGAKELFVDSAAGSAAIVSLQSGGVTRWAYLKNSTPETGSDAGSDFELRAHNDAGANLGAVALITRAAGGPITLSRPVVAIAGSAADPSIEFPNGRGIYADGTENINFTDGDVLRVQFRLEDNNNTGLEFGRTDGTASLVYLDFHTGATAVDFDARILVQNGTGVVGGARMDVTCAQYTLSPAGSDSAPTLARTTDLDTGLLWPSANTLAASAGNTRVWTATTAGVEFPEGISFGSEVAASAADLSRHLALYSTNYGFGITANRLNFVAPSTADFVFLTSAGADLVYIDGGGDVGIGILPTAIGSGGTPRILQVHSTGTNATSFGYLALSTAATGNNSITGAVAFGSTGLSGSEKRTAQIISNKRDALTVNPVGDLQFQTSNGGLPTTKMTIGSTHTIDIGPSVSNEDVVLQLGNGRTGNGYSIIDLVGDATHTNFGLRLMRLNTGANTDSEILHRGTGALRIEAEDAGSVTLGTSNTVRLTVDSSGVVSIGANVSFDQTAANNENPTVSQFVVTNGSDGRHRKASASHAMQQARAMHVIASQAIATGTNTTTINLPAGNWLYVDLVIHGLTAGSDFAPYLRVNSDSTGANYRYANNSSNASGAAASGVQNGGTTPGCINLWSTTSLVEATNHQYSCTVRIYNPASTTIRKSMSVDAPMTLAAADGVYYHVKASGIWLSTAAITSLTLHLQNAAAQTIGGSGVNATAGTMYLLAPL